MAYTNVPKPTDATYTTVNSSGREQYDQATLEYDSLVFYDGIDENAYTNLAKPTSAGQSWDEINGDWASASQTWNSSGLSPYTNVSKPTT